MAATVQLHTARVKFPAGRELEGRYGPRINVVVTLSNGEEVKLWDSPGGAIASLKKGDTITVIFDGKNYGLATSEPAPSAPTAAPIAPQSSVAPNELTSQQKRAWAADIEKSADLLRYCYQVAQTKFEGLVDDPTEIRALATTLFIQSFK